MRVMQRIPWAPDQGAVGLLGRLGFPRHAG